MKKIIVCLIVLTVTLTGYSQTGNIIKPFAKDTITTNKGKLILTFFSHSSLMLEAGNIVIHVDPVSSEANYSKLPKADLILYTHEHDDHFDPIALAKITQPSTKIVASKSCQGIIKKAIILVNGASQTFGDFFIKAVPAYNIVNKNKGIHWHPKGDGNGYLISFGGKNIYLGGDTENIPEMADLKNIDIAFLPMKLPFTMDPQMVADAAKVIMPKVLYPYHTGDTNPQILVDLLKGSPIEVRVRQMK